ncbi:MAG: ACP S-malonyltransferase [Lachnospiraceae bacterium]|nr:ACP S-malonyltransferase [Lachnospiraceae bacterium]
MIAFVFPGQGAQVVGMGKDFYENSELSKNIFDEAAELLDFDVKKVCFEENEAINITEYTQAAMLTTSVAMLEVLKEKGLKPDVCAGLSLGEYCALVASGVMDFEDALKAVRQRGILMQEAVPTGIGAMSAIIGLDADVIAGICDKIDEVSVANYNCPGQIVITGKKEAVEKANEELKEAGARRCVMLNVSGPFHSEMLKTAGEELYRVLENVELKDFEIPYVTNVTAKYVTNENKNEIKEMLKDQVSSSVLWIQSVENMIEQGVDTFVEIGPGKTLTGFIKKIAKAVDKEVTTYNVEKYEDVEAVVNALA